MNNSGSPPEENKPGVTPRPKKRSWLPMIIIVGIIVVAAISIYTKFVLVK